MDTSCQTQEQKQKQKIVLLIDLDGVCANWYKAVLEELAERFPDEKFPIQEDLESYFIKENFHHRFHEHTHDIVTSEGFYLKLEPYRDALIAMSDMVRTCGDWLEPFICSKPCVDYDRYLSHSEKIQWVNKHLGSYWAHRTILTTDKTLVHGEYLIDDCPGITGVNPNPSWMHLLNVHPYNKEHSYKGNLPFTWGMWPTVKDLLKKGNLLTTLKMWPK